MSNNNYFEDLPTEVNPEELPLRELAPCWSDGKVTTEDYDTKDAICICKYMMCQVDRRNIITLSTRKQ